MANNSRYSVAMANNGMLGGLQKGKNFKKKYKIAILNLYIAGKLNQQEIADKLGISQSSVCNYTKYKEVKIARLQRQIDSDLTEEEIKIILQKIELEIEFSRLKPNRAKKIAI